MIDLRRPLAALVLAAMAAPAQAQSSSAQSVQPGDRIRVTRGDRLGDPLIGRLVRLARDSVWLLPRGLPVPVSMPLGPGVRLDRSLGRKSHIVTGALVGAGVGAAATAFFLSVFCGGDTVCDGDEQLRAAAIIGLPCLAVGAGIGAMITVERWAPLPSGVEAAARIRVGVQVDW
jgi:hypothetical protein